MSGVGDPGTTCGSFRARAIGGIEAINLKYFPKLKYEYLVKVVEACDQTGIKKINFAGPPEEAAATP